MSVETKKMSNSLTAAGGNFGERMKAWPDKIRSFYNEVRTEMRKVTWPSMKEVRSTTTERLEFKKFCRRCRKHTAHKEVK